MSRAPLVLLSLSLISTALAQTAVDETVSPERKAAIEGLLPLWPGTKAKSERMAAVFRTNATAATGTDPNPQLIKIAELWTSIEKQELSRLTSLKTSLDAQEADGTIDTKQRQARYAALTKTFQLKMLYLYGNMVPRIIDEFVVKDGVPGRRFAGAEWGLELTNGEFYSLLHVYADETGFTREQIGS